MSGRNRRVLLEEPAAGNLHGGICEGGGYPGGAMVDLNGHEAGNGGHSQGKPTAHRDSSTRRDAMLRQLSGQSSIAWRVAAPRYRGIVAPTTQLVGRLGSGVRSTKSALSSRLRRTVSSRSSSDTGKIL
jgi:hypothetical protein